MRNRQSKRGATLVEVILASAILLLVVLSLLEGFIVAARIARENNGAPLVADAYAFDLAWTLYNQDYRDITIDETGTTYDIADAEQVVPSLTNPSWPAPQKFVRIQRVRDGSRDIGRQIAVEVWWGPADNRKVRHLEVMRSSYNRAPER